MLVLIIFMFLRLLERIKRFTADLLVIYFISSKAVIGVKGNHLSL
jgi:hypothetical protein